MSNVNNDYTINAAPTKELFINTLIRDVSIMDAILDLADNSVDGYIRHGFKNKEEIKITLNHSEFTIYDTCGGINLAKARDEVFRFGITSSDSGTVGVYGIGMKRSIFKLGKLCVIESDDLTNYFKVIIDVNEWQNDNNWNLKFKEIKPSSGKHFTKVRITQLKDEVSKEFASSSFQNSLIDRIQKTYYLFMKEKINITFNKRLIPLFELVIGFSKNVKPAHVNVKLNSVDVKMTAGVHPDYKNPGWYVFFNERLIILGDSSSLTGWGNKGVPSYHNKFNRFKGFAFVFSKDPSHLPWNTAKNNFDISSPIYLSIVIEMQKITRQYTSYMTKLYPTESDETLGKRVIGEIGSKPVLEVRNIREFTAPLPPKRGPSLTSISYIKEIKEVDKLKKCMGNSHMTNKELGEKTFEYYRKMEC